MAPAGYGKTSLGAQWYNLLKDQGGSPVWVPLEHDDCDQGHFLLALLESFQHLLPDEARGLDASSMPVAALLSVLVTRLRRIETPVTLFLDDYHFAQTDGTESLLAKLLAASDLSHVKFVLISRSSPRFPTSTLRLNNELRQIGVTDLSFSDTEAQEFFAGRAAKLTPEQVGELNQRTEGWAVALQMVRVLVNDNIESGAILSSFDGSNAEMGRYLSEQVFSSLPEDIRHLLTETAALPAVSRALVTAVCSQSGAGALFSQLGDYALPIAVLDGQGTWIRYHPVFNSFLKEEAERVGIETGQMLRKAARWFAARNDCDAAVRHALLAGDAELAAEIIEAAGGWRRVYATTRGGTLLFQTLIARAAEINLSDFPLTTLGLSVVSAKAGQLDAANHYLAIAERGATGEKLSRDLRVVRVLMSLYTDRWATAADLSALEADLSQDSDMELIHRALALNMLSYNFLIRTDLERALHYGQLAMRAFRDGGADFGAMHLYTHIGQAAFFSGDSASAADSYRNLIAEAQSNIGEGSDLDAVGQVLQSEVLSMSGEQEAASSALSWALPHLERHDTWFDLLAAGFMAQQRVFRLNGDVMAAHAAIDSTRAAARRRGFDRLTRLIDGERATLLIASGDVEEAIRYAEVSGFNVQNANSDGANNLAVNLRGCVPALLWTRIYAALGETVRARAVFRHLMTRQAQKPHVPRRIELGFMDIRLLLAEDEQQAAAAALSDLLLSLPVADYRAILQVEGTEFADQLRKLTVSLEMPGVVTQRLFRALDAGLPARGAAEGLSSSLPETGGLTERERGVMLLLSAGLSNKEIGRKLNLSDNTVKFHLRNIFAKLNVTTRTAAVMAGRDIGTLS
ncbi:LuxR C-terminal-related transcriptional regulator [Rhizobium herbae]|uniref:LuxR family maltose regulon positive regulatory protein n=1 Tax=Rhizobium herbae TaxID=508661 RepID=A0ABS4EQK6_9HYPH|nr:LuxR C-terminal-related transcriptional regulator [Rhizobium herbae]MBP1860091.1 LuxR family maltose regulon positive regulatory protein [Rhizobium herbae]